MIAVSKVWRRSFGTLRFAPRRRWSAASARNCQPGYLAEPGYAHSDRLRRVGPPQHPAWRSASLPPCRGPSHRDGLESGLHRSGSPDPSSSRHSSVAHSTLEEAVNPESAKDCVTLSLGRLFALEKPPLPYAAASSVGVRASCTGLRDCLKKNRLRRGPISFAYTFTRRSVNWVSARQRHPPAARPYRSPRKQMKASVHRSRHEPTSQLYLRRCHKPPKQYKSRQKIDLIDEMLNLRTASGMTKYINICKRYESLVTCNGRGIPIVLEDDQSEASAAPRAS